MSLDAYCQIHSLLTNRQATVEQLHALQQNTVRAQDIKQVIRCCMHLLCHACESDMKVLANWTAMCDRWRLLRPISAGAVPAWACQR